MNSQIWSCSLLFYSLLPRIPEQLCWKDSTKNSFETVLYNLLSPPYWDSLYKFNTILTPKNQFRWKSKESKSTSFSKHKINTIYSKCCCRKGCCESSSFNIISAIRQIYSTSAPLTKTDTAHKTYCKHISISVQTSACYI